MEPAQLKEIYTKYAEDAARVYKDAKPTDGLFGWGDDPGKDPCHMRFYEDTERWVKTFLSEDPARHTAYEAARILLETPAAFRENRCFWFMYAAQGLARELIPRLSPEQCTQLRAFYDGAYPRRDRMPVQKDVYRLLKKGAK